METPQQKTSSGLGLAIATLAAILGTLLVNTLSNFFPPGGQNVGEIANTVLDGVMITPANYAFAIWGLIYVGLIAYGIYQLGPSQRRDASIQQASGSLIVACVSQMVWIFLFTLQYFAASVFAMLGILLPLIGAYVTLGVGQRAANRQRRWYAHYPFSVYLGWISVATVVNVAAPLYVTGWGGFGISIVNWTAGLIVVTAAIAALMILTRQDMPFTLVFLWAYGAIAVRNADVPTVWMTALVVSVLLLGFLGVRRLRPVPSK